MKTLSCFIIIMCLTFTVAIAEDEFVFRGGIKFGMTPEEVMKYEETQEDTEYIWGDKKIYIQYDTMLLGREAAIGYNFNYENMLYEIECILPYNNSDADKCLKDYYKVVNTLDNKYGKGEKIVEKLKENCEYESELEGIQKGCISIQNIYKVNIDIRTEVINMDDISGLNTINIYIIYTSKNIFEDEFVFRGGIKFGMTPEEVMKYEEQQEDSKLQLKLNTYGVNFVTYTTTLLSRETVITYFFTTTNKLYQVIYEINYGELEADKCLEDYYNKFVRILNEKYGKGKKIVKKYRGNCEYENELEGIKKGCLKIQHSYKVNVVDILSFVHKVIMPNAELNGSIILYNISIDYTNNKIRNDEKINEEKQLKDLL